MIEVRLEETEQINIGVEQTQTVEIETENSDEIGVSVEGPVYPCRCSEDYDKLKNKPKINGITVEGSKLASEYGLQNKLTFCTNLDIDKLFK